MGACHQACIHHLMGVRLPFLSFRVEESDFVWACSAMCLARGGTARLRRNLYMS